MIPRLMSEFAPLARLQDEMNRLLEGFTQELPEVREYSGNYPAMNLWEDGDSAYLESELPGLSMDDVSVLVSGNEVTISGERKITQPQTATWHRRERGLGKFSRMLTLPWQIDAEKVEAKLHDGILLVKLPKAEISKPRKIKVLSA